ncbi:MAG: response regulator [Pseudomonadota bacterium]
MKILIIDRDTDSAATLASKLRAGAHEVVEERVKSEGIDRIASDEPFDVIFVDPAPMKDASAILLNIRRAISSYPYIILMTTDEELEIEAALAMGCNNFIRKPLEPNDIDDKIDNASNLIDMIKSIGDTAEDFPSSGGVIAKSAFNQLFLSAIDRGSRYSELAHILRIGIKNFSEIESLDGQHGAQFAVSKLAHHLVRLRRQSDIIGQTEKYEYTLLLQRIQHQNEPREAAARFAKAIEELDDIASATNTPIEIYVHLTSLPIGRNEPEYLLIKKGQGAVADG